MDATAARAELEDLLQWQAAPTLSSTEIDRLFARVARGPDATGYLPGDSGYIPTYTSRAVGVQVGLGWLMKAGKVAGQYEVGVGSGKTFKRDQQYIMCLRQAALFGAGSGTATGTTGGGIGSLPLGSATARG